MTTEIPGFSTPAAGFDRPLEMLSGCHLRVARQLATLRRLVVHLQGHGSDNAARDAALAVLRYFDTAAPNHHADEEVDLFPALIESIAGSDAVCLRQLTERLVIEHRTLEKLWHALRPALLQVSQGHSHRLDSAQVRGFIEAYEAHLACEDSELLPIADRLLSQPEIDRIGQAMELRRRPKA